MTPRVYVSMLVGAVVAAASLSGWAEDCAGTAIETHIGISAMALHPSWHCPLTRILDHPDASGRVGPMQTPISLELYEYLLDRPIVVTGLMQSLGLGRVQVSAAGPRQYWIDDGDGAEGLLTLVYQEDHRRVYHVAGRHRSRLFPDIEASTVVLVQLMADSDDEQRPAVRASMASYTRFQDGILTGLLRMLSPLVRHAVHQALERELTWTHRLGTQIARDPERVREHARSVVFSTSEDRAVFLALLPAVSPTPAVPRAAMP